MSIEDISEIKFIIPFQKTDIVIRRMQNFDNVLVVKISAQKRQIQIIQGIKNIGCVIGMNLNQIEFFSKIPE